MKICTKCKILKPLSEYSLSKRAKRDGRQSSCKECCRAYMKKRYLENRDHVLSLARKNNKKYRNKPSTKIKRRESHRKRLSKGLKRQVDFLKANPCVDCGFDDHRALEFDHRDPSTKKHNVSDMRVFSDKSFFKEAEKCEIRCANCHKIKTALQFNWYKSLQD